MPKKKKSQSELPVGELKSELETIRRMYKNCPPEKRQKFWDNYNRIVETAEDSSDEVRNMFYSFRDALIKRYGDVPAEEVAK